MKSDKKTMVYFIFPLLLAVYFVQTQTSFSKPAKKNLTPTITDTLITNRDSLGLYIELVFEKGPEHNHPLMAVWIEDTNGKYLQTAYVAKSIAKGVFEHGDKSQGTWKPGPQRRPAALPVWSHKRGIQEEDGLYMPTHNTQMPDGVTGATPKNNFVIQTFLSAEIPKHFILFFEINQSWDWNEYWTNNLFPDDENYKTSCQPSLVYKSYLIKETSPKPIILEPIGHGHPNGADGLINTDLSTFTTALEIAKKISVSVKTK